ncbi:hypothetical protein LMG26857_01270 [Achromobacter anxifer]|uniref:hypothetical protein n=1 Tax=Achromobacter anxifer TaxID=1287737 RepID=UPI00155C0C90|nr:hypothetical protein [Achromobacter anxifer]CAB5511981.1 hypothetical protein LMG26857_01270 [Achromobacter anxifer]
MHGHPGSGTIAWSDHSASIDLMRKLAFVELMELLEFSVLRLDRPQAGRPGPAPEGLIGTQDWWFAPASSACAPAHAADAEGSDTDTPDAAAPDVAVYVCSSQAALREAVLPDGDTQLDFGRLAGEGGAARAGDAARGLRLYATADPGRCGELRARAMDRLALRVDLKALLSRVVVPARVPQHIFELVASVVRSRVWVEVVRPEALALSPQG